MNRSIVPLLGIVDREALREDLERVLRGCDVTEDAVLAGLPEPPFEGAIPTGRGTWIASEGSGKVPTEGWEARMHADENTWRNPHTTYTDTAILEARPVPEPERTVTVTLTADFRSRLRRKLEVVVGENNATAATAYAIEALIEAMTAEDPS